MVKKKIMLIDDEEPFCNMVKLNLERSGEYEVRVETKGERAYNAIKEFNPDIIFLDIIMPDVDGAEIALSLRKDEELKHIPVVFLTAMVKKSEEISQRITIGNYLYPCLAKPITIERLIESIKVNAL